MKQISKESAEAEVPSLISISFDLARIVSTFGIFCFTPLLKSCKDTRFHI